MVASRLAAGGLLLLALLALALDGKPAPPQPLRKAPAGGTTAWRRELTEQPEGASRPAAGGGGGGGRSGSKAANAAPTAPKSKGGAAAAAAAAARLMRDLRPDSKQARAAWGRMVHPEHHAGGGGGGGGGGGASRRLKGVAKKGLGKGCFGLKLDRIGSMSGLGC
uniref:C-type natriuretic peptide n=1 Tax=Philodryas olfersii TaxID=120305 RepID=VNP_PHIOL|nr:RecName: Full=C-type natriuretic peptide; Short=CNP; Flags: Precursor [Philodryas olfersii]ABI74693.1 C-type natriuretic peptide precursor [Philodryas olfersii]